MIFSLILRIIVLKSKEDIASFGLFKRTCDIYIYIY